MRSLSTICLALVISACALSTPPEIVTDLEVTALCQSEKAVLDVDFDGAGGDSCEAKGNRFILNIRPEDKPINPSPWYALRVTPKTPGIINIVLSYEEDAKHRYYPKFSQDGKVWSKIPKSSVDISSEKRRVSIRLNLDKEAIFIAGQEVYTPDQYDDWMDKLAAEKTVERLVLGQSMLGHDIIGLYHEAPRSNGKTIFLVGRQHPPEVTGALAMTYYLAELFSSNKLSNAFRNKFDIVMVPMMNPDGVMNGYWRHNMGSTDLNRDWGPFAQVETQAVKRLLDKIANNADKNIVLFLDFHSTRRNVFYTQTKEDEPTAYDFTGKWLERGRARLPDYEFERAERHNTDLPTSKNYMHSRFNIPAITYELGDHTERELIKRSAEVFAQEMMRLLLEEEAH